MTSEAPSWLEDIISLLVPPTRNLAAALNSGLLDSPQYSSNSQPTKQELYQLKVRFEEILEIPPDHLTLQGFASIIAEFVAFSTFLLHILRVQGVDAENKSDNADFFDIFPRGTLPGDVYEAMVSRLPTVFFEQNVAPIINSIDLSSIPVQPEDIESALNLFYSKFLKTYDPKTAKRRGVVNTSPEIVDAIVEGIDALLKRGIDLLGGILDEQVEVLDPSCGTMAFPCGILRYASKQLGALNSRDWFHNYFLKHIHGFEVLSASYCAGILRIAVAAQQLGTQLHPHERPDFFLMNALAEETAGFDEQLGSQTRRGLDMRDNCPVTVILGNPPYNVSTQNRSPWITNLIETYKEDLQRPGFKPITGLKNIQNDYVKFIRFAQWRIERTGYGVVGFVTQNYFLDGLVFRGMRSALRHAFNEIYVVNLHGDMYRGIKSAAKNAGVNIDQNIFGIREGVCLLFLLRKHEIANGECQVRYCETWGSIAEKFRFLSRPFTELPFEDVQDHPDFLFIPPKVLESDEKYASFPYLPDIFANNIQGIVTGHDTLVSHVDRDALEGIIDSFYDRQFQEMPLKGDWARRVVHEGGIKYADARDWTITYELEGNKDK
ncbi:MAG TPA: hypothetical protein VKK79_23635, partial [Candidatus Lokiarchaeia archaeon]|nr:hypothetical protein [Candidatus Lokiarchaeia archaeon]